MNKTITSIAPGKPFAKILAGALLDETADQKESLTRYLILLPTRRACRVLREAFLDLRQNEALLLPRMQPIGDLDEEELSISLMGQNAQSWNLPPALPALKRQIMLAEMVQKLHQHHSHEQALKLAQALGHLMDQVYTENLNLADLSTIVPEEFSDHWQITLKFLEILSDSWPKILAENNAIDQADRRNRLILALAEFWQNHPPQTPVIGAGSTGSIPATRKLLSVIAGLPQGQLILPGLDQDMDEQSWNAMNETHPQFGFRELLSDIRVDRYDVAEFHAPSVVKNPRAVLAHEIMRPAETTTQWADLTQNKTAQNNLQNALKNLALIECENIRKEADTIAVLMRQTLNTPDKTACLITPDRNLATRVAAACARWDITIDDSAGQSLKQTPLAIFMRLALKTIEENFAPTSLLALLKHKYCALNMEYPEYQNALHALDYALRGPTPAKGFGGLRNHIHAQDKLPAEIKKTALMLLETAEKILDPAQKTLRGHAPFIAHLKTHLALCEALAQTPEQSGHEILWQGETGNHASRFFAELFDHTQNLHIETLNDYTGALEHFMDQTQIRPTYGTHPRLQILGQLEARLIDADLVILGGLNEGSWPPDPGADPWMSRPMRKEFGLPGSERSIGLAAHDFVQGLCADTVVLTRSLKTYNAPSVPSRWLQRLHAVLQGANIDLPKTHEAMHWAAALDYTKNFEPALRPMPTPPIEARPTKLSVTRIENWLRDPYGIYARYVLNLKILDPLEKPFDAAERGTMLHAILDRFSKAHKTDWPQNPNDTLLQIARDEIDQRHEEPHTWSFWWPRFERIADWLIQHEADWRKQTKILATESRGQIEIDAGTKTPFTLTAIADRIDEYHDGHAAIIDYKSGGTYSKTAMQNGQLPQLPLEALILSKGGFAREDKTPLNKKPARALQYWVLSGSGGGKITTLETDIPALLETTEENLKQLIKTYADPAMPYICLPYPEHAPRFNDYEHLARVKEWSILGDTPDESEAA